MNLRLKKQFKAGDRVEVSVEAGWRKDSVGIIKGLPEPVVTIQGDDIYYWVKFDEPQHDLSEDGPYEMAQVLSRFITNMD